MVSLRPISRKAKKEDKERKKEFSKGKARNSKIEELGEGLTRTDSHAKQKKTQTAQRISR